MMSKKSPQLRFEGFTDAWEERKLSSGLREYTDRVIVEDDKEYYQISVRNNFGGITLRGSKMGNKIGRKRQAKINLTKYPQTLIFTRQTVEQGGIGWVDKYCDGAIVTENMPTISLDTSVFSKYFLTNLFQTRIFYKNAILDNIEGGSAQIAIHESKFLSSTLLFPNLDEQEKIGQFFKQLDDTIDLHQRKLDLLKEQKKGYLQKMFPKNGAKVAELRFAGLADDWEERKFKDNIVSIQTGTNLLGSTVNEGTPLIKMGNLQRGYFSFKKLEYLDSNSNVGSEDIVNYGDFLFNTRNTLELVGKGATWTGIGGKYAFNSNIARFKFDGIDTIFFNYLYNTQQVISQVHARAVGTTSVSAVYPRDLNSLLYYLPSIEEQQKIGSFFKQLDDTIALHQRKLDLLKEQKKGFLQKMFV